ncbi:MAG: calcium-binding protein [Chlorobiaceae bacterium]|nr:calcium-binding protein [Chlorobiaceae bacterium]
MHGGDQDDVLIGDLGYGYHGEFFFGNDDLQGGNRDDLLCGDAVYLLRWNSSLSRDAIYHLGDDNLKGGDGNDFLFGDALSIENSTTTGSFEVDGGSDKLNSGSGDDFLAGGWGNDTLTGGTGYDDFIFNTPLDSVTNVDRITDFNHVEDQIQLDPAICTGVGIGIDGTIEAAQFALKGQETSDTRIIYNARAHTLAYDADGNGDGAVAVVFVVLAGTPTIDSSDFVVGSIW